MMASPEREAPLAQAIPYGHRRPMAPAGHGAMEETILDSGAQSRLDRIATLLWWILWLNLMVAVAKLLYGHFSGAIAIRADGFHSLVDASSNVLALIGIRVARRPPDANHPYGHRKYETFAALGVAAMMFIGCQEILLALLDRIRHPHL